MPDYAGAKAAIRARLVAGWTTTQIIFQNKPPAAGPWPPVDGNGNLVPWVNLEIKGTGSEIAGTGTRGNHLWHYDGIIYAHVFVPVGSDDAVATEHAVAIGELFRAAEFYNATPGFCVRTLSPSIDDGDDGDDDGNWFRVSMSVPFTYWHRG